LKKKTKKKKYSIDEYHWLVKVSAKGIKVFVIVK
jgi:hypothetical protein